QDIVRVWLPRATTTDCQEAEMLSATLPGKLTETTESRYGNPLLFFEAPIPASGEFMVDVPYRITRHEVLGRAADAMAKLTDPEGWVFLAANQLVPTSGQPLEMLKSVDLGKDQVNLARQLYDVVDAHMVYKKDGTGWGRGDSNWACTSGYGNCTDF